MNDLPRTDFVDLQYPDAISFAIDAAHAAAAKDEIDEAVRWFDLCRTLLIRCTPAVPLKHRIDANLKSISDEAERTRNALIEKGSKSADTRVVILGDSLALPRAEEKANFPSSIDATYPGLILSKLQAGPPPRQPSVWTHCQRYFTTNDAVALLETNPDVLAGAHVLIHLGLNDCAVRMFMDNQRLAIGLLPAAIGDKVLSFSRTYRSALVESFPGFSYVPIDQYRANLYRIASLAQDAGAASLTFTSVIVVPWKFWPGTPGVCRNFTTYNLTMMDTAAHVGALVLDVDRLMWQNHVGRTLVKDGMHLSPIGHELLADEWIKLAFG